MVANSTGETVGEVLKRARESKKLSIEEVHRQTKISPNVLRALEQDDLGAFVSETYLKGFLRTYASFLGLDPSQVWGLLSRQRGSAPDGKGTFWDIEEAVREEKLRSSRIVQRVIIPLLLAIIVILAVLYARERSNRSDRLSHAATAIVLDSAEL